MIYDQALLDSVLRGWLMRRLDSFWFNQPQAADWRQGAPGRAAA